MPHTRSWDETKPAGANLISSGDNTIREISVDIRERAEMDHVWNSSTDHDGKHKRVRLRPANNTVSIETEVAASTTGSDTSGLINLAHTLNTSGIVNAIRVNVVNTASAATSLFMQLLVGGSEILTLGFDGVLNMLDNTLRRATLRDYAETKSAPTISGGTLALDCEVGNVFEVNLNANITTLTISNWAATGKKGSIEVWYKGDGTQRTIAHGSIRTPNNITITPTATNGDYTVVTYHTFDGGTTVFAIPGAYAL